jgi:hypothetical protein
MHIGLPLGATETVVLTTSAQVGAATSEEAFPWQNRCLALATLALVVSAVPAKAQMSAPRPIHAVTTETAWVTMCLGRVGIGTIKRRPQAQQRGAGMALTATLSISPQRCRQLSAMTCPARVTPKSDEAVLRYSRRP